VETHVIVILALAVVAAASGAVGLFGSRARRRRFAALEAYAERQIAVERRRPALRALSWPVRHTNRSVSKRPVRETA
jgi:hypothetical protein